MAAPPVPKSPPEYLDLYGKRREMAKVQMLEREIGFLQEELKSVEGLQHASRCCKEISNFVVEKSDPFFPTNHKKQRSCGIWKWLCGNCCFNFSCIGCWCCCDGSSIHLEKLHCCDCNLLNCQPSKWQCCFCPCLRCCKKVSCRRNCCIFQFLSCPNCCCCCKCSCPKCPTVNLCFNCSKTCCNPSYLC